MTDRLTEIKARLDKASYERRPLKLHAGCKNPPNCSVCVEYRTAYIEWESYLMDLQSKAVSDESWLIAELERLNNSIETIADLTARCADGCMSWESFARLIRKEKTDSPDRFPSVCAYCLQQHHTICQWEVEYAPGCCCACHLSIANKT